jgi:hypothetical protein
MPTNKKESFIYTLLMCAFMVFVMSLYNVSYQHGLSLESVKIACLGFPLAYIVAMLCDWFVVSKPAKVLAFKIVSFDSAPWKKIVTISSFMVCGMVVIMSLYGAIEVVGFSNRTLIVWLFNIPMNFILALPLQLLIAGPFIRFLFRKVCPIGTVCA